METSRKLIGTYTQEEVAGILATPEKSGINFDQATGYKGPVFLQGDGTTTCAAWATTHSIMGAGAEAEPEVVTQLLNAANLSEQNRQGGLALPTASEILNANATTAQSDIVENPGLVTQETVLHIANLVEESVTEGGLVIVDKNPLSVRSHALSVPGYTVDENGRVEVQVVGSLSGESKTMGIEALTRRIVRGKSPIMRVRRKE